MAARMDLVQRTSDRVELRLDLTSSSTRLQSARNVEPSMLARRAFEEVLRALNKRLHRVRNKHERCERLANRVVRHDTKAMGLPTDELPFANRPAVGKITISSPAVLKPFATLNDGKSYAAQLKPFNFLVGTHVRPLGHPVGVSPERFHLIAPYERNPAKWLRMDWIDQYSERVFKIITKGQHGTRLAARVKTYGEVVAEYETHPEAKCADREGRACTRQTVGLLRRRHVSVGLLRYIGKESNAIEDVDAGLVHAATDVYTEYPDPRRDEWDTRIVPVLKRIPLNVFERLSGKPRKMLIDARLGRRVLRSDSRRLLASIARQLGLVSSK